MAASPAAFALSIRYQRALASLARRLGLAVAVLWERIEGIDDQAAAAFAASVAPLDLASQRQAVTLADAYIAAFLTREFGRTVRPRGLVPEQFTGPAVRSGATDIWQRPTVTARAAITRGRDYTDARAEGRARAVATGRMNVALSARAASAQAMTDHGVTRYRRVTAGACCALCAGASTKTYGTATLMPLHNGCSCGVEPVVETGRPQIERPAPTINDSPEVAERAADGEQVVKIVEHDELGPMLWQVGHDFSVLSQ